MVKATQTTEDCYTIQLTLAALEEIQRVFPLDRQEDNPVIRLESNLEARFTVILRRFKRELEARRG
jgi:hypothetical protein